MVRFRKTGKQCLAGALAVTLLAGSYGLSFYVASAEDNSTAQAADTGISSDITTDTQDGSRQSFWTYLDQYKDAPYPTDSVQVPMENFTTKDGAIASIGTVDGKQAVSTGNSGSVEWKFQVKTAGLYAVTFTYQPLAGKGNAVEREIRINGKIPFEDLCAVSFPRVFCNETEKAQFDKDGNQLRPNQIEVFRWETKTLNSSEYNASQILYVYLKAGENKISLEALKEPIAFASICFRQPQKASSYATVQAGYTAKSNGKIIHLEGENATYKSDRSLYATSDRSSPLNSPSSLKNTILNMIGGSNWSQSGQFLEWEFDVPQTGLYQLVIRAKQDTTAGQISSRCLTIDGVVPFAEAEYLSFPYQIGFANIIPGDGKTTYLFQLEKGKHTLRLTNNLGKVGPVLEQLSDVLEQLNSLYKKVFMITGSYPDVDRDYNIALSVPGIEKEIQTIYANLESVKQNYIKVVGSSGSGTGELEKMQVQMDSFLDDVEKLPARLDNFRTNISNLSSWLLSATSQPLTIDTLDFLPADATPQKAEGNFFQKLYYGASTFFISFVVDYNNMNTATETDEQITVWLGTGRDQAQALKTVVNNQFTQTKKIGVNIRLVDINVLLPAVAAGYGPDVALSLERSLPMNYAYRGAVQDLTDFDGFEDVLSRFPKEAVEEFRYGDKYYALPDKFTYYMMFYRTDILEELGMKAPATWDDVYTLLPQLQNRHMTVGLPNIGDNNVDIFFTLLYQQGGQVYDNGLTKALLDKEPALNAFKQFTDFYTKYKVYQKIDQLTYFRMGQTPIVFAPVTFFANLEAGAPEIKGRWEFAQLPSTVRTDGTSSNIVSGTSTGCCIFSNSKHKQAAWQFMNWWTGTEAQAAFGIEIESIQGTSGRYASANLAALDELPWTNTELAQIKTAAARAKAMPEAPGGYMTTRYIVSSAMTVINNGLLPKETIMDYNKMICDEVISMRKKFDLDKA